MEPTEALVQNAYEDDVQHESPEELQARLVGVAIILRPHRAHRTHRPQWYTEVLLHRPAASYPEQSGV